MANLREYRDVNGKLKAYYIRVYRGKGTDGRQLPPYTETFQVPETWSETTARKKAEAYAALVENLFRSGMQATSNQTFQGYAEYVIQLKSGNGEIVHSTEVRYRELTERIYPEIGHIKLKDLKPQHLNQLYSKIKKDGVTKTTACAKLKLQKVIESGMLGPTASEELVAWYNKTNKISRMAIGRAAHLSASTVSRMLRGENVQKDRAEAVATALGYPVEKLFSIQIEREDLSSKTIREYHQLISSVLHVAEKEGLVPRNVAAKASPPKSYYPEAVFYPPELVKRIIAAIQNEALYWRAIAFLIIFSGARRGEILGLRFCDLDFDRNRIHICQSLLYTAERGKYIEPRPKNKKRRYVSIAAMAMATVKEYIEWRTAVGIEPNDQWKDADLVFINPDGEPYSPDGVTDWFSNLSKKYDLPHIHPHGFRHSAASALIFNGADTVSVAGTLGHASPTTTEKIYAHFFEAAEKKNEEILSTVYGAK